MVYLFSQPIWSYDLYGSSHDMHYIGSELNEYIKLNKKSNYMLILENGNQVPVSRSNKEKIVNKLLEK